MVATWQGLAGWDRDPELSGADIVIAQTWAPLVSLLRLDERFRLAYEDETAVVFYRMTPFSREPSASAPARSPRARG
jgi:hypothetical protein